MTFDDVLIIPEHSDIPTRNDTIIDLSTSITNSIQLKLPIITANMDTVTNKTVANLASKMGALGIIHRFQDAEDQGEELIQLNGWSPMITCIGVGHGAMARLSRVMDTLDTLSVKMKTVLIDIAHGDSLQMVETIRKVKSRYPEMEIIAGNVSTTDGALRLIDAGAATIKVGVGPGACCSTRINTGCGYPQLSAISNIADALYLINQPTYIIADGGIRNGGDIMKALAVGANAVMSYRGAHNLTEFREGVRFVRQTSNGVRESTPHGVR